MRLPWLKDVAAKVAVPQVKQTLFEITIVDGHSGSGYVRFRQMLLAASYVDALGQALESWVPDRTFESGISIQVHQSSVWTGGYRNASGAVALMERPHRARYEDEPMLVFTEFDGTVMTFSSDAKAWIYLQDHHYQPVR